jgi:uncharacterized protein YbaP (TraB family)
MRDAMKPLLLLVAALFAARPAFADTIQAHPALWHVRGPRGEAYLLGSAHILPPDVQWRTPQIVAALARADVFVFEVPEDAAAIAQLHDLIQSHGYLPAGETLRGELHPAALADFDAALAASGVAPDAVAHERPWLAGLQMMFAQLAKQHYAADSGVDSVLMGEARAAHTPMRYLETIPQQFALLAPDDRKLEVDEFESGLDDLRDVSAGIQPIVDAWAAGDQAKLDAAINGDLDKYPDARKELLDDRNRRWVPQIAAMLREHHVFFITVGAGHLTGPVGVPALLRAAGFRVDGP